MWTNEEFQELALIRLTFTPHIETILLYMDARKDEPERSPMFIGITKEGLEDGFARLALGDYPFALQIALETHDYTNDVATSTRQAITDLITKWNKDPKPSYHNLRRFKEDYFGHPIGRDGEAIYGRCAHCEWQSDNKSYVNPPENVGQALETSEREGLMVSVLEFENIGDEEAPLDPNRHTSIL